MEEEVKRTIDSMMTTIQARVDKEIERNISARFRLSVALIVVSGISILLFLKLVSVTA